MSADPDVPGITGAEIVGRGGFGTVYAADEPEFGRRVAVKVLHDPIDSDGVRRAFTRECRAMGAMSGHPHIVAVHRSGTTPAGAPYIVMDLMSGGSLADRLQRQGPLPWPEVVEIGVLVAGALETAHRAGVLHLDLKPANVLVSRFGEPKLGDFGISRLPGVTATTDGQVRASVPYAAPERLLQGTATAAADVYGLGATLFALLTGRPAFVTDDADLVSTVARVAHEPVPDLRLHGVPDAVAGVVERLMGKTPVDRPGSAVAAAEALQAAQAAVGRAVTRPVVEGAGRPGPDLTRRVDAPLVPGAATLVGAPSAVAPAWLAGPTQQQTQRVPMPAQATEPPWVSGAPARVPDAPGRPSPSPRRRAWLVGGAVVAALAVGVAGTLLALRAGAGPAPTPAPVVAAGATTDPPVPAATPTPTTAPSVPATALRVAVADDIDHPETTEVAALLDRYFEAVDEARYEEAFRLFTPDSRIVDDGFTAFAAGFATTSVEREELVAVRDRGAGVVEAEVRYRSRQSPEQGVDGQTCTDWHLAYELVGTEQLIRRARTVSPPLPC